MLNIVDMIVYKSTVFKLYSSKVRLILAQKFGTTRLGYFYKTYKYSFMCQSQRIYIQNYLIFWDCPESLLDSLVGLKKKNSL